MDCEASLENNINDFLKYFFKLKCKVSNPKIYYLILFSVCIKLYED